MLECLCIVSALDPADEMYIRKSLLALTDIIAKPTAQASVAAYLKNLKRPDIQVYDTMAIVRSLVWYLADFHDTTPDMLPKKYMPQYIKQHVSDSIAAVEFILGTGNVAPSLVMQFFLLQCDYHSRVSQEPQLMVEHQLIASFVYAIIKNSDATPADLMKIYEDSLRSRQVTCQAPNMPNTVSAA